MRIVRLATCVLLLLALGGSPILASGFENTGLGTTARGMGGAFRAIANDWSAAYYNPAGYAFIADNQLGGNVGFIHYRNEITPNYVAADSEGNSYEWGIVNGKPIYNFHRILNRPAGGFLVRLPFWGETVFGLSVYQPFDYSVAWRFYSPGESGFSAYNDSVESIVPSDQYKNDLDVVAFQLSAGREFMENKLALGLGLQVLRADLWFTDLTMRRNPRNSPINDRPRDRIPEFSKNEGKGWSFGLRGGLLWKLNEKIDVAVTGYMPFDVTVSGTSLFTYVMPLNHSLADQVGLSKEDRLFVTGGAVRLQSDFEANLKLPPSFAVGLAYKVSDALTVALDAEYTL
jgi:long-chain fatty acid transport protein